MKVHVTFFGMFVLDIDEKDQVARVLAINAAGLNRPYHHPILCANPGALTVQPRLAQIPSLDGLLDRTVATISPEAQGWHLSGTALSFGTGKLPDYGLRRPGDNVPTAASPSRGCIDWIPFLNRIQPGSSLKKSYREISRNVLSVIELRGGTLRALPPSNASLAGLMFWFSPVCQQAVTDMIMWEGDIRGFDLVGGSATLSGENDSVDLFITHEAPAFEKRLEFERIIAMRGGEEAAAAQPRLEHFASLYNALDNCPYQLGAPAGVWRYDNQGLSQYVIDDCIFGGFGA